MEERYNQLLHGKWIKRVISQAQAKTTHLRSFKIEGLLIIIIYLRARAKSGGRLKRTH